MNSRIQAAYVSTSSHSANGACLQSAHVNSPTSYSCMLSGKAVLTTTIRLRFDRDSTSVRHPSDCNSTALRPFDIRYDRRRRSSNKLCAWRHNMPPSLSSPRGRPSASRPAEHTQRSSTFPRRQTDVRQTDSSQTSDKSIAFFPTQNTFQR